MAIYSKSSIYRILIIGGSGSGKANALLNLINNQPDIDEIYLYTKDPYEAKYQYLIKKRKKVGLKHYDDLKAFIEYSDDLQDVYNNIEEYNLGKKHKILIVFYDMIADMINNKKFNPVLSSISKTSIGKWYFWSKLLMLDMKSVQISTLASSDSFLQRIPWKLKKAWN